MDNMKIINHLSIDGIIPNASGQRAFPTTELAHFDPFVMLDHIGPSTMPANWRLDGGSDQQPHLHPHRGFETITFMLIPKLPGNVEFSKSRSVPNTRHKAASLVILHQGFITP